MGCRDCREIKPQTARQSISNLKDLVSKQPRIDSNGKPLASLRWNPTQEQLFALEELYRRGTRTPSAQQIQQITSHLRRFGKIEGKNVFYWFQNHKARERQRRIRDKIREIGLSMKSQELRQAKTWMPHLKSSSTLPNQESWSTSTPAMVKESRRFRVFQGVDDFSSKQTPWKSKGASCSTANPSNTLLPSSQIQDKILLASRAKAEDKHTEIQTLQLFPLKGGRKSGNEVRFAGDVDTAIDNGRLSSSHFFEFLPLKL